jgi:membrane protein implicated in regulation of membrane protease activity
MGIYLMDSTSISWIFIVVMTVGVTYLLISIVMGGLIDFDVDVDADIDGALDGMDATETEARGLGCSVISVFLAGFGAVGLLGTLSGFSLIVSIIAGSISGVILGRVVTAVLRYVMRQQSNDLLTAHSLIGTMARVTVDIPAGRIGEALVEGESLIKYATKAVSDEVALKKGDYVEIMNVENGRILVKKKRQIIE